MFILKLQTLMLRNRPVLLKRRGSHTAFTDQQTFTTMKPLQPNKNKIIQNACLRELVDAVFVFLYIVPTHTLVCMYQYRRQKKCAQLFFQHHFTSPFPKKVPHQVVLLGIQYATQCTKNYAKDSTTCRCKCRGCYNILL